MNDGEEDKVHGGAIQEHAHGSGAPADFAEAALDGIGGAGSFSLCLPLVGVASRGGAGLGQGVGVHDGVEPLLDGFQIDLADLVQHVPDLVRPAAVHVDRGVYLTKQSSTEKHRNEGNNGDLLLEIKTRLNSRIVCICDRLPGTSGGWIMDVKGFQAWLSAASGLTRAQRREALAVLSGRSEGEASKAAIELGVDEARRCPHCAREWAVSRGMARGLRRYQCKGCGRTFNALTGTPLSGLHHKERWLSFGASLAKGETVKASAARCDVAVSTAFRWRHRFLAAARSDSEVLKGIVEADETYVLESRKGARGLGRKARRRGGKAEKRGLSREQVPVFMAADRSGTTVSAVLPRGRCGGARGCPRSGGREGRPAGLRRRRELPSLRRRARGEPRNTQPLDGGTGSGRSAGADGEQPPQ